MKKVTLLGSTGSIGENTLKVASALAGRIKITGLAVQNNFRKMLEQAERFNVKRVAVADPESARKCAMIAPRGVTVFRGPEGLAELAGTGEDDIVLCAVVGMAGLKPVISALKSGTDVALATKEVMVAAGGLVTALAKKKKVQFLPVDSEHSAVFQCLQETGSLTGSRSRLARILLTASGGPFEAKPEIDFNKVKVKQVLAHPRWNMGRKVTVDSATLMNKGLEIMEARWLFDVPYEKIDVVIHPESIVHSMVEFVDGSVVAQLSLPDMRFAIQYALTHPQRYETGLPRLDLTDIRTLHFRAPDVKRFPCLGLARSAAIIGGTMPVVLNAANEIAVQKFLDGHMPFSGIWKMVARVMDRHKPVKDPGLDGIIEADKWARVLAERM